MKIRPLLLVIIILVLMVTVVCLSSTFRTSAERKAFLMGTDVRVKVEGASASHLANLAIEEVRRLDRLFSKFDPQSEIYRLNHLTPDERLEISADTSRILQESARLKKLTRGAFDIRLGQKRGPIDLGAIAKGYAVEVARRLLMKSGARSGIIDLRSSIAVFGPKVWKVGIQHPRDKKKLIGTVELKNGQSLATSGDYERGKHVIDPRTGKPAQECQSVTIIGEDAAEADALSTAVFVLGPREGMKLADKLNVRAIIVDKNGVIYDNSGP